MVKQPKTPEMREKLRLAGAAPVIQPIPELEAFRAADGRLMAEIFKAANIKIE